MAFVIAWICAEYVRAQLECAYFLDLLDDGEEPPDVRMVGRVTTKRGRSVEVSALWNVAHA